MKCIFCGQEGPSKTRAHIIPESLGGRNSPIGSQGVTCDSCNQYFGQKVESKALASFPFIAYRSLFGVPTKKKALPVIRTTTGDIHATGMPGIVEAKPRSEHAELKLESGKLSQFRILAEVTEPLAVCRMLLKIGLEQLGKHFYEDSISPRVKEAIEFSRRPRRGQTWWFILRCDPQQFAEQFLIDNEFSIEILEREGILLSAMHLAGISTMIPLEGGIEPPPYGDEFHQPEYRVINAVC